MKRLMIAAAILLTTGVMSVWAQGPINNDTSTVICAPAQQTRPVTMTDCPDKYSARSKSQKGCSNPGGDVKSGRIPVHQMMQGGMMSDYTHPRGQDAIAGSSPE
jgi:hypothetical protein